MQICHLEKNAQLQSKTGIMNLSVTKSKLNRNVIALIAILIQRHLSLKKHLGLVKDYLDNNNVK